MEHAGSSDRPVETPSTRPDGRRRSGPVRPEGSSCRFTSSPELVPLVGPVLARRTNKEGSTHRHQCRQPAPIPTIGLLRVRAGRSVELGVAEGDDASVGSDLAITNIPHLEDGSSQLRERREAQRIQCRRDAAGGRVEVLKCCWRTAAHAEPVHQKNTRPLSNAQWVTVNVEKWLAESTRTSKKTLTLWKLGVPAGLVPPYDPTMIVPDTVPETIVSATEATGLFRMQTASHWLWSPSSKLAVTPTP